MVQELSDGLIHYLCKAFQQIIGLYRRLFGSQVQLDWCSLLQDLPSFQCFGTKIFGLP